jgi:hypothetical protein
MFSLLLALFTIQPWSFSLGAIPLQVLLVIVIFLWAIFFRKNTIQYFFKTFNIFQWSVIFIIIISIIYRNYQNNDSYLIVYQVLIGILLSLISSLFFCDSKSRKIILYVLLITCACSSLVAIMQRYNLAGWSWQRTLYQFSGAKQPSGLESYPVSFSFSIVAVMTTCICMVIYNNFNKLSEPVMLVNNKVAQVGSIVMLYGLFLSQSRSGMLGVIVGIFTAACFFEKIRKRFVRPFFLIVILGLIVFLFFFQKSILDRSLPLSKYSEVSTDSRLGENWKIFIPWIIKYPLGIPINKAERSNKTRDDLYFAFKEHEGVAPHNFLLIVTFAFGIPAGLAYAMFYVSIFLRAIFLINRLVRSDHSSQAIIPVVLLSANASIVIHSWFHNASLIQGEMRAWFWVGALMGCIRKYQSIGGLEDKIE